jgi:hypothetical protein
MSCSACAAFALFWLAAAYAHFLIVQNHAYSSQFPVQLCLHVLLPGEMVVDDVDISGEKQRRRYLVYDCMMLAGEGISDLRFEARLLFSCWLCSWRAPSLCLRAICVVSHIVRVCVLSIT